MYYHVIVKVEDLLTSQAEAEKMVGERREEIEKLGGKLPVSNGFGLTPNVVVVEMPDESIDVAPLFPGYEVRKV